MAILMVDVLLGCGHISLVKAESVQQSLLPKVGDRVECTECRRERPISSVGIPYWDFGGKPELNKEAIDPRREKIVKQMNMEFEGDE